MKEPEDKDKVQWPPKWALPNKPLPDEFWRDFDERMESDLQKTGSLRN